MTIMVVGASSFIGGNLTSRLVSEGGKVIPVYRNEPSGVGGWWTGLPDRIIGDIRQKHVQKAITDAMPDTCVYLVSLNHHDSAMPVTNVAPVNLLPVWSILETWQVAGWKGRFIYMSTQQVYGRARFRELDENVSTAPTNYYGLTHLLAEKVCSYFVENHGLDAVAVRLSNSYGAPAFKSNDCWWIVVNELVKMAVERGELVLKSDGSPTRDFVHVEDVASCLMTLAGVDRLNDRVMNLGSGVSYSIYELACLVQREYERRYDGNCDILQEGKGRLPKAPHDVPRFTYDTARARRIGFRPSVSLSDGISRLFDYLEHPDV